MSDITKLPKWAQKRIRTLERQLDAAVDTLKQFTDTQTPSHVSYMEIVGLGGTSPNEFMRKYIQTSRLEIEYAGVHLGILLSDQGSQRDHGIHLSWHGDERQSTQIACVPTGFQAIGLIAKENLR